MKAAILILLLGAAPAIWSQSPGRSWPIRFESPRVGPGGGTHRPGIGGGMRVQRPARVIRGWGAGGWGAGGWGWANQEPVRVIIQSEPEEEKQAPPYVVNKDYVAERLAPRMTELAAAPAAASPAEWKGCGVSLVSGERFEGAQCAEVDDTLLVKSASGRRYRFSRDLIAAIR